MGKDTTISGELVARAGCKRELQSILKSQSEICGDESVGRTRASRRKLNAESTNMEGKESGNKKIRVSVTMTISDLPEDLIADILSRFPMTFLRTIRSTCKRWNAISKNWILGTMPEVRNQILGFTVKYFKIHSVRMDLQGIHGREVTVKEVSVLRNFDVSNAYYCNGLLLLSTLYDKSGLLVWNPYLGQTRWIRHMYKSSNNFVLGYDNNRNHKILEFFIVGQHSIRNRSFGFKIYEFSSNSWRKVLNVTPNCKILYPEGITLKGNAYFYAQGDDKMEHFLLCFDFTKEKFGPRLSLPFPCHPGDIVVLSSVRDKQMAVLYQLGTRRDIFEIWVTSKIGYNEVTWTKWIKVEMTQLTNSPLHLSVGDFFIDEENKIAVVFNRVKGYNHRAYIIGPNRYYKSINVEGFVHQDLFGYSPSLVQIE